MGLGSNRDDIVFLVSRDGVSIGHRRRGLFGSDAYFA